MKNSNNEDVPVIAQEGWDGQKDISYENDECKLVFYNNWCGCVFKDVPSDSGYRYVQVTYTKSGGNDVRIYPNHGGDDYVTMDDSAVDKTIVLPAISVVSTGVKILNSGNSNGTTTIYIKSIKFYKNNPS